MKILIIRFGAMGDVVFTTSVLRVLKEQMGAEIHFVCKKVFEPLLSANPNVDKLHLFDGNIQQFSKTLGLEEFNLVLDLQSNIRSKRLVKNLKQKTLTVDKLSLKKWLFIYLGINKLPKIHFAERCIDTVKSLGVVDDKKGMDFYFPEDYQFPYAALPQKFIAFVLGATHFTKRMPKDKILEIINNTDSQIILIGGDDVKELGLSIEAAFDSNRINNMVGIASITDSAYILSKSNLVIAPDTGMLHIAAALKKPTISIWGSTVPDFGVYPYYGSEEITHLKIEDTTLSCRPCSKHGSKKCPKDHFKCMNDLDTADLVEKIKIFVD